VLVARQLYALIDANKVFSERDACLGQAKTSDESIGEQSNDALGAIYTKENTAIVHPNPAQNNLQISYYCSNSNGIFTLISLEGKVMMQTDLDKNVRGKQLDIAHLPRGIYTYEISFVGCGKTVGKLLLK
jgi:Secretion system C-terminal sorting domain